MTTAAQEYRALVAKLEAITEAPVDPRSQAERDSQMTNFKGAYKDWEDLEAKKANAKPVSGQAATPAAAPLNATSGDVKKIQTLLNNKGAGLEVDGRLGPKTLAAIIKQLEAKPAAAAPQAQQPTAASQPGTAQVVAHANDMAQKMVGSVLNPYAKGGLFNR